MYFHFCFSLYPFLFSILVVGRFVPVVLCEEEEDEKEESQLKFISHSSPLIISIPSNVNQAKDGIRYGTDNTRTEEREA